MTQTLLAAQGVCTPRFSAVQTAFERNFSERGEVGAAFCLWVDGQPVVDLWSGARDAAGALPWTRDTVANVWSTTKGVTAACFAMLVDRGRLSYEDKVADHWPAFAAEGKGEITIGMLLSHQAGLSGFTSPAVVEDLYAGHAAAERLAAQAPIWPPGTASGYHAISFGLLATELFERVEGRSLKQFVADELAGARGLDIAIGLGPSRTDQAAEMLAPAGMGSGDIGSFNPAQVAALTNPGLDPRLPNTAAWRAAEIPSANGFSNARALAGLYAGLLLGAKAPLVSAAAITQATEVRIEGRDLVLDLFARWGAGFLVNSEQLYGPNPEAFGHSGWGGSFAFADPKAGIAMAYTMNQMSQLLRGDPRGVALIDAVYGALDE
ncbi:serine hydrolase domain-containing protein [Caulobacter segnis]|uniref:Esterase n=1 Tax=Caulobacter segnis TaxID=88688 RepID=A0A2W5UWW1_9CAUL|nr:serine hydrolase domain-containing protein [Caulobacter segnis]PZR31482.1 MAG: esterase [Caulobacter segnis]